MSSLQRLGKAAALVGALLLVSSIAINTYAGPANFQPTVIEQPDGTRIKVRVRGDEFQGWTETMDGYTIVANPATGYFEYATVDAKGKLVPSGLRVLPDTTAPGAQAAGLPPKGLRPSRDVGKEAFQRETIESILQQRIEAGRPKARSPSGTWSPVPVSGTRRMLVILLNFSDEMIGPDANRYWYDILFNPAANSVVKYYADNSWGKLSIQPVAHTQPSSPNGIVTVTLPIPHPNCKTDRQGSCDYDTESTVINAALAAATPWVNFAALDTNGDGKITRDEALFYFIWSGYDASATPLTPSVWAHAWSGDGVSVSGKTVPVWAINGEYKDRAVRMGMGVVTHELGHQMGGLPDLYDTGSSNKGLGMFSVMAAGSWGAKEGEEGGTTATGLDAWSRQYLGWTTLQTPTSGQKAKLVSGLASQSSAYMLINEAISSGEYWLVENRPPLSWDAGIWVGFNPGYPDAPPVNWPGGLLVQHIDLNVGTKDANDFNKYVAGKHQGNVVVEPSTVTNTLCSLMAASDTEGAGCPTLLHYQGNGTTFNDSSTPNSRYYDGRGSGFGILDISAAGSSMTATFGIDPKPYAVNNYQGLWWNPGEPGWGINFAHQGEVIFATWYTYDADGKPWWLISSLNRSGDTYSGEIHTVRGQAFDSVPWLQSKMQTSAVGTMTLTFASTHEGNLVYSVNGVSQSKSIKKQLWGTEPTCVWGAQPDSTTATNYTDIWWNENESGWGVNLNHQSNTIYATWFTFDASGQPWWLVATMKPDAKGFTGDLSTIAGPPFSTVPWDQSRLKATTVGTMSARFGDGSQATLIYTLNGISRAKSITRQVFVPPGTVCSAP